MNVPLIDLKAQYRSIGDEVEGVVREVLASGAYVLGKNVQALEEEIPRYLGTRYSVGVASGTDALILALRALDIGLGDEVIVPSYTFFATASSVRLVGATPVVVDVDSRTYGIDVGQVERRITPRTRAVIPVHLFGHPADMAPLLELAESRNLAVIEDAAQALGSEYRGAKAGGLARLGCLSFYPTKNLGGMGDGGMVVTSDRRLYERLLMLRSHGWRRKYRPEILGYNSRLDEVQAAILRVKLRHLDHWNERRRQLADRYTRLLGGQVGVPFAEKNVRHIYHLYVIRVARRDELQGALREQGIASAVYYPLPLHLTDPIRVLGYGPGDLPVSEAASRETLAIPLYPEMEEKTQDRVVAALHEALAEFEAAGGAQG